MQAIIGIAFNTFKEAIRNRILYVILIFALLMILFSGVVSELTIASTEKILMSIGFTSINIFGVAIAIFLGVSLVYNELEKRTIYTIVSKPIGRWQFLLGKYFGLLMTVYVNVLVMTLVFLASMHFHRESIAGGNVVAAAGISVLRAVHTFFVWNAYDVTANIMQVIAVTALELAVVTSFAVLFSSFSTPTLSMFFTVLTFVAGRMNADIVRFADHVLKEANTAAQTAEEVTRPMAYYVALAVAHITPNLGAFHETVDQAIYLKSVQFWWGTALYGLLYAAGVLVLSVLIFNQRNFK